MCEVVWDEKCRFKLEELIRIGMKYLLLEKSELKNVETIRKMAMYAKLCKEFLGEIKQKENIPEIYKNGIDILRRILIVLRERVECIRREMRIE